MQTLARGGDAPHIIGSVQKDYKRLYYSEPGAALKVPVTLQSGYGLLDAGTALAKNVSAGSAGGKDQLLPYIPTLFDGTEFAPGRVYIVGGGVDATYTVNVTINDSYKFKVGDDLFINDNTTTVQLLGAITAIDRTTYRNYAVITFTTVIGGVAFTTALFAYVGVEAAAGNTNNYSDCVGILEKTVDTGTGENAAGAVATLILGNCVLYKGLLTNFDAAAMVDVSATDFGQFVYIK